jgi:hypothetical protein
LQEIKFVVDGRTYVKDESENWLSTEKFNDEHNDEFDIPDELILQVDCDQDTMKKTIYPWLIENCRGDWIAGFAGFYFLSPEDELMFSLKFIK